MKRGNNGNIIVEKSFSKSEGNAQGMEFLDEKQITKSDDAKKSTHIPLRNVNEVEENEEL